MSLQKADKVLATVEMAGVIICGISVMIMMLYTTVDVVVRTFSNVTFTGTYERVQAIFMPMAVFPGIPFAYRSGVLPMFDSLTKKMKPQKAKLVEWSIAIIEVACFSLLAYYSWFTSIQAVQDNMAIQAGGTLTPTWWVYFGCTFGFNVLFVEILFNRFKRLFPKTTDKDEMKEE